MLTMNRLTTQITRLGLAAVLAAGLMLPAGGAKTAAGQVRSWCLLPPLRQTQQATATIGSSNCRQRV